MENELSHWWLDLHPFLVRVIQGEAFELFVIGSALPLLVFRQAAARTYWSRCHANTINKITPSSPSG